MTTKTINKDQIKSFQPGFTYTEANEQVTISHGITVSSSLNAGIFSDLIGSSLSNHGKVISASNFPGVQMISADSFITNAKDGAIQGALFGIKVSGSGADVVNAGSIRGVTGAGVFFDSDSVATSLTNSGTVFGKDAGVLELSRFSGGTIRNGGSIASNFDAIDIDTNGTLNTVVVNTLHGTIHGGNGDPSNGIAGHAIRLFAGTISLTNQGTIIGNVEIDGTAVGRDRIFNTGKIAGTVKLNAGSDLYLESGSGTVKAVHGGDDGDTLIGGNLVDRFFGDNGNDLLRGGAGNDSLHGGFGSDTLVGGAGKDQFFFDAGLNETFNVDRVKDFTVNVDKIVLDDDTFFGIGPVGVLSAAAFHIGKAAANTNQHIVYDAGTGFVFFDIDGAGGQAQSHFATLAPHLALHNTDFVVVA